jgi:hypothetical protein
MREREEREEEVVGCGLTVLPLVLNPADQIRTELDRFGLRTF